MSWYRTGTVTVATGSKNVTGVGTLWASSVNVGDAFALVDANGNPTGAWYEVETVTSNTALVLKQTYTGTPEPGSNKQYAVFNLVGNMTTPSFAQRLAQFFDQFQNLVDLPTTTPTASSIPIADGSGLLAAGWLPAATTSAAGAVELATSAEAIAGTATDRAVTPAVSGSRLTFATTSPDDATSATAAPLKSAGGLAVAGNAIIAKGISYGRSFSYDYALTDSCFNATGKGVRFTIPNRTFVVLNVTVLGIRAESGASSFMNSVYTLTTNSNTGAIIHQSATPLVNSGTFPGLFEITITKDSGSTNCFLDIRRSSTDQGVPMNTSAMVNISGITAYSSYTNAFSFVYVS